MAEEEKKQDGTGAENTPGTGDTPGEQSGEAEVTFTDEQQAKIDDLIEKRLARARKTWESKAEKDTAKAKEEAERQRLKEQAEWQKLAEKAEAELAKIKPQFETATEKLERYEGALGSYLDSARADVPDHITGLLDRLDPVEQLNWLTDHAEELGKPKAPRLNAGEGGGEDAKKVLTDQGKVDLGDMLNVDPRFIPDDVLED